MVVGGPARQPSFEDGFRQIGLEAEWVRTAVGEGNRERIRVLGSENAMSAEGFYAWNGILASLTLAVQGCGWERRDPLCLPVLIERNKKNVLFVSSGDPYTGVTGPGRLPRSRNPKGAIVAALARQNKKLLPEDVLFPVETTNTDEHDFMSELLGCTSYVLLVHFSQRDLQARYEVSRLGDVNTQGYLSVRHPRWVAPPYPLTAQDFGRNDPNEGFDGPGDYPVPPKS